MPAIRMDILRKGGYGGISNEIQTAQPLMTNIKVGSSMYVLIAL